MVLAPKIRNVAFAAAPCSLATATVAGVGMRDSDGRVTATSVAQSRTIEAIATRPAIGSTRAAQVARGRLTQVDSVSTPHLVVYAHGTPRLAWETTVRGARAGVPSRQSVYADRSLNLTKEGCVLPAPQASHPKR
jgi:hypothetical protein